MAVGLERAHAEFGGQGEGLLVVISGLRDLRSIATSGDLPKEAQGIRLVAAFLVRTGMRQRPLSEGVRLLQATGQREQARTELSTAIALYRDMEMTFWLPETEAALAQVPNH